MISEKEYWDVLEKIAMKCPVSTEFLAAAIPAELVDDHLEDAAAVAQALIGAGFLPHQVHTLLRSLVGRASR